MMLLAPGGPAPIALLLSHRCHLVDVNSVNSELLDSRMPQSKA